MKKRFLLGVLAMSTWLLAACGSDEQKESETVAEKNTTQEQTTERETVKVMVDVKELTIEANGRQIYGKLYVPTEGEKHPAIIMSHGYNGCHADFAKEASYYAKNGYVAYTFDFCGGSVRSKSSGKSTDMTVFTEKEDLLGVFDYISAMDCVDSEQVYLFGGSQGGFVTALAAEERADKVKGVALYYPAFNIPDDWRNNYKTEAEIPESVDFWGLQLGKGFFTAIREFNTYENVGKFDKNVLIISGDKDEIVTIETAQKAKDCYANSELVVLPGEGHGFTPAGGEKAMGLVLEFLKK